MAAYTLQTAVHLISSGIVMGITLPLLALVLVAVVMIKTQPAMKRMGRRRRRAIKLKRQERLDDLMDRLAVLEQHIATYNLEQEMTGETHAAPRRVRSEPGMQDARRRKSGQAPVARTRSLSSGASLARRPSLSRQASEPRLSTHPDDAGRE